ncbi:MAG: O-antigen ligase family protein [Patescibacteria group bacterium]
MKRLLITLTSYKFGLVLFFLILLFFPLNLSKHFILNSSFVSGLLLDYLIPTIYVSDILLFLVACFLAVKLFVLHRKVSISNKFKHLLYVLVGYLLVLFLRVENIQAFVYSLKTTLFLILVFYFSVFFSFKKTFKAFSLALSITMFLEALLGIFQFFGRGSVFDNFLFFGEVPYSFNTLGITRESYFGVMMVAPYATFPHPNVFGGFLVFALLTTFYSLLKEKSAGLLFANFQILSLVFGFFALLLTKSTSAFLALIFGFAILLLLKIQGKKIVVRAALLVFILINFVSFEAFTSYRFNNTPSFFRRGDLIKSSSLMIRDNFLFGVGTASFTRKLEGYGGVRGIIRFVHPVHNIFLLVFSELGLVGFLLFILFLIKAYIHLENSTTPLLIPALFFSVLTLGVFDHYLLTIQQGLFVFWLTLSLVLSTMNSHETSS